MNKQPIARDYAGQLDAWTAKIWPVPALPLHSPQLTGHLRREAVPPPSWPSPLWLPITAPSPPHVSGVCLWTGILPVWTESSKVQG